MTANLPSPYICGGRAVSACPCLMEYTSRQQAMHIGPVSLTAFLPFVFQGFEGAAPLASRCV